MPHHTLTIALLGGLTLFGLWCVSSGMLDLAPDEAHFCTTLGGATEVFVRLPAVLLALGTALLATHMARTVFQSDRAGLLAVLVLSLLPLYAAGALLMTIDAPFMFFWVLALLALHQAVLSLQPPAEVQRPASSERSARAGLGSGDAERLTSNPVWWGAFGIALGLGFLSKYTMLLLLPCLGVYLLRSRLAHTWLRRKDLAFALLLGSIFTIPVIVWNAQHGWVSLRHVLGQAGLAGGAAHPPGRMFAGFFGSQLGVVSPLLFLALVGAMIRSSRLGLQGGRDVLLVTYDEGAAPDGFRRRCERLERAGLVRTVHRNRPANSFSIFHCQGLREIPPEPERVRY